MKQHIILISTATLLGCTFFADVNPRDPEPKAQSPEMGPVDAMDQEPDSTPDLPLSLMDVSDDVQEDVSPTIPVPVVSVTTEQDGPPSLTWEAPKGAQTTEVCVDGSCVQVEGTMWRDDDAPWPTIADGSNVTATSAKDGVRLHANPTFEPQERMYTVKFKDAQGEVIAESSEYRAARTVEAWQMAWERSTNEQTNWNEVVDLSASGWGTTHSDTRAPTDGSARWYRLRYRPAQLGARPYTYTVAMSAGREVTSAMALGGGHTCALLSSGAVECWGNNSVGQVGLGTGPGPLAPGSILALAGSATRISLGDTHSCAELQGGGVQCWGRNTSDQLGVSPPTSADTPTPTTLPSSVPISGIAPGHFHTCALTGAGNVTCWGAGGTGGPDAASLGGGTVASSTTPDTGWTPPSVAVELASGLNFSCARLMTGEAYCWGINDKGQLGQGGGTDSVGKMVPGVSGATKIDASTSHACAIIAGGALQCWGANDDGQVGIGVTGSSAPSSTLTLPDQVQDVATGRGHTCAVLVNGDVHCWGLNDRGQLGLGSTNNASAPSSRVPLPAPAQQVFAGASHSCALVAGQMYCWGYNQGGQIGNGMYGAGQHIGDDGGEGPVKVP